MKTPSTIPQVHPAVSSAPQPGQLKQAITDFLSAAAGLSPVRRTCPLCGQSMQYIDTVFWLYGEERSFPIRLQRCPCTAELPAPVQGPVDTLRGMD